MTMQQQKKRLKKSYDERLHEIKLQVRKTVGELGYLFVPELCELYREEHPEKTNREIQDQVTDDLSDIWERSSIYVYLPSWVHNQKQVSGSKKGWETRNANKLKKLKNVFEISNKIDIQEPTLPEPKETFTKLDDEELDKELHSMQMDKFGTTGKSIREIYGDITHHANGLFETLTQKEMPYADNVDLIVDYIKPSREYWRSLMLEFDETKRTRTHNELSFLAELIEDRLQIISEVKDK